MISPSLWMIIGYMLTAPFSASLKNCVLRKEYRELNWKQVGIAAVLGMGLLVSIFRGIDAVLNMYPLAIPFFCFALWCSSYFAMDCVKKNLVNELDVWDAAWAVCCYFGFLVVVFFITPAIRWCEGCMEYH